MASPRSVTGVRMGVLRHARSVMRRVGKVAFGVHASPALIERVGVPPKMLAVLRALHDGKSVVVSAPTGSGKTVCGM